MMVAHVSQSQTEHDQDHATTLPANQIQCLLALLETPKSEHDRLSSLKALTTYVHDWILESEASNHMSSQLNMMVDVKEITLVPVGLPNSTNTLATKTRKIRLIHDVALNDVLFVLDLTCKLISINQLIRELTCCVAFIDWLCWIQDHTAKNLIGGHEMRGRVYFFKPRTSLVAIKVDVATSNDLWHRRMGHLYSRHLGFISEASSDIKSVSCDICL